MKLMKLIALAALLLPVPSAFTNDTKISDLTLGVASGTDTNDSFPYVDSVAGQTKRLKLSDLVNIPSLASTFAPIASPTFTGTVTAPAITSTLTGTATNVSGIVALVHGGTGVAAASANAGFNALSPMTTLGDLIYGGASGAGSRLQGDTSNTRKFLRELSVTGVATAPVWDTIAAGDIPTLNQNTSGTAADLSATLSIAHGGTGQTTAANAINALLPSQGGNSGKCLGTDASNPSWVACGGGGGSGVDTVGTIDGNTASDDGLSIASTTIYAQSASATKPGMVNLTTQTFAGAKTFSGGVTATVTGVASGNTVYTANNHGVVVSGSGNTMTVIAPDASTVKTLISGGASADPAWGVLALGGGGTGATTKAGAYDALSPMTTLGDITYGGTSGTGTRLAGDTSNTRKFLREVASAGVAQPPSWDTIVAGDVPTLNQNTSGSAASLSATLIVAQGGTGLATLTAHALQVGNGTTAITQLAAAAAGKFLRAAGTSSDPAFSTATLPDTAVDGDILYASATNTWTSLAKAADGTVLTLASGHPSWASPSSGTPSFTAATKTTTYTLVAGDFIAADSTSASFTMTLPDAATNAGKPIYIAKKDSTTNTVTISRAGSDTFNGGDTTLVMNGQNTSLMLMSVGTLWFVF